MAAATDLTVLASGRQDVWIVPPIAAGVLPHRILNVRSGPRGPLVRLSGIDDAAGAHELVGHWLLGAGEELLGDEAAEAFIGMRVLDETRGDIGLVSDVIVTGANDVLVVTGGRYGEVLVPVIDDVMLGSDEEEHVIRVALLDGLIDGE